MINPLNLISSRCFKAVLIFQEIFSCKTTVLLNATLEMAHAKFLHFQRNNYTHTVINKLKSVNVDFQSPG